MHFLSCAGELNHHGVFMCNSMYNILGDDYRRITTDTINKERLNLGYKKNIDAKYNIEQINADRKTVKSTISWSDVVDFGAAPEIYLEEAVKQNKIVFIRIERLLKEGNWKLLIPHILIRYYRKYIRYKNNPNVYFLCVSAYAAKDLAKIGIKGKRVLQWAYCPEFKIADENDFVKKEEKINILWCGRMIDWKHPEMALKIATLLKNNGCNFNMKMIGDGEKKEELKRIIKEQNLDSYVEILGSVDADRVRNFMRESDVFLATSDKNEGWGVVINEAMNSACVVFATPQMGAAPVLLKNNINGFYLFPGNEADAAKKIIELNENENQMEKIKIAAYETIKNHFTPDIYAKRFVEIANDIIDGNQNEYTNLGSIAKII